MRTGAYLHQQVLLIGSRVVQRLPPLELTASTLALLKNVVFPVGVYLYFTGFLYTYDFYSGLGIPLNSVEIPFYYLFVYSYNVFSAEQTKTLVLFFVAALTVLVVRTRAHPHIGLFLVLATLFPVLAALSRHAATAQIAQLRTGQHLQTINLIFKGTAPGDDELLIANAKGELKLVVETRDRLYVMRQAYTEQDPEIPVGALYGISKSDVLIAKVVLLNIPKPGGTP